MALEYISGSTGQDKIKDGFRKTNEAIANIIVSATTSGSTLTLTKFDGTTFTATTGGDSAFKSLSFVINQTGTSDPSLTVLENDVDVSLLVVTRISTGIYRLRTNGSFTLNKTFLLPSYSPSDNYYIDKYEHTVADDFLISCRDLLGNLRDIITDKFLEIKVYN